MLLFLLLLIYVIVIQQFTISFDTLYTTSTYKRPLPWAYLKILKI